MYQTPEEFTVSVTHRKAEIGIFLEIQRQGWGGAVGKGLQRAKWLHLVCLGSFFKRKLSSSAS